MMLISVPIVTADPRLSRPSLINLSDVKKVIVESSPYSDPWIAMIVKIDFINGGEFIIPAASREAAATVLDLIRAGRDVPLSATGLEIVDHPHPPWFANENPQSPFSLN